METLFKVACVVLLIGFAVAIFRPAPSPPTPEPAVAGQQASAVPPPTPVPSPSPTPSMAVAGSDVARSTPAPVAQTPVGRELPAGQTFDAVALAAAETRMWKAYYSRDAMTLLGELTSVLQVQFHLKPGDASSVARDLGLAAAAFQRSGAGEYERAALPNLTQAYTKLRELTGGTWSADAAARAELAWWVRRRTPGKDSPEEVGRDIASLYSILYGGTNADIENAGLQRARAAALRDSGKDWAEVERLLRESYQSLVRGAAR